MTVEAFRAALADDAKTEQTLEELAWAFDENGSEPEPDSKTRH